jgi:hypothetical protein
LLKDPKAPWREFAFARNRRNIPYLDEDPAIDERVVRDACWKLHQYLYKPAWELYDLCSDPRETNDLANSRPEIVSRMAFELMRNLEESRPHQSGPPSGLNHTSLELPGAPKY